MESTEKGINNKRSNDSDTEDSDSFPKRRCLNCACWKGPDNCDCVGHICCCRAKRGISDKCKSTMGHYCICKKRKNFKCRYLGYHPCLCDEKYEFCTSENHKCICNTNSYVNIEPCRAIDNHPCVCLKHGRRYCFAKEHVCSCIRSSTSSEKKCSAIEHQCVCYIGQEYCVHHTHHCVCYLFTRKKVTCMSLEHGCICFLDRQMCKANESKHYQQLKYIPQTELFQNIQNIPDKQDKFAPFHSYGGSYPADMIELIFKHLDYHPIVRQVCKRWNRIFLRTKSYSAGVIRYGRGLTAMENPLFLQKIGPAQATNEPSSQLCEWFRAYWIGNTRVEGRMASLLRPKLQTFINKLPRLFSNGFRKFIADFARHKLLGENKDDKLWSQFSYGRIDNIEAVGDYHYSLEKEHELWELGQKGCARAFYLLGSRHQVPSLKITPHLLHHLIHAAYILGYMHSPC